MVDNAFIDFENDYNERIKSIAKALKAEIYGDILQKIKGISDTISDNIYKRFNDEQLIINERLDEILKKPKQDIGDVSVWLDILLFITRYNFTNVQNEIFGYVYENYLKDLYLDEKKGQYFTDPLVVEFMLDELGYTKENLKKIKIHFQSLILPAGVVLFYIMQLLELLTLFPKIIKKLQSWRKNSLMRTSLD